jgi:hypothetical protein
MTVLDVEIVRFVNPHQPGVVECSLTDAWGGEHRFIEKVPVVTSEDLTESSSYPRRGVIACGVVQRFLDPDGREIVTIDTMTPWGIESKEGHTQFDVAASMLIEI